MRALLDHSVPRGLRTVRAGVEARHASEMGSHELRNGDLLRAAERDGFNVLIPSDKNIRHQNPLGDLRIAVLELGTNHWPTLQRHAETVRSRWPVVGDPRHVWKLFVPESGYLRFGHGVISAGAASGIAGYGHHHRQHEGHGGRTEATGDVL